MLPKVQRGTVILRRWDDDSGLHELSQPFDGIDSLFAICLQTSHPLLVDRVIIEGVDTEGDSNTVTLVFQSMTVHEDRDLA